MDDYLTVESRTLLSGVGSSRVLNGSGAGVDSRSAGLLGDAADVASRQVHQKIEPQ